MQRILLLAHYFNSLTQRLWIELCAAGHEVSVELDVNDRVTEEAVTLWRPDLVIAPFLKRRIPDAVWRRHRCIVIHPGIRGDRGPSALDWAIMNGETEWGVTALQANGEMDAGDVWAEVCFPMRAATKSSLYRNEVTEAAVAAVHATLRRIERGEAPDPLDYADPAVRGRERPPLRQAGRTIDWTRDETATVLRVLVELLRDEDVQHVIDRMIVRRIAEPQWGPPVGRVLGTLLAENRQEALIQLLADRAFQWSLNAGEVIQRVVERDSPSWSPRFIDHLVGDRIHRELMDFTDKVRRNPDHELRRSATRFLFEFAGDLQNDPATIARADAVKEQLMARNEVANAAATAWKTLKRLVLEGVDDPSSTLRTRIADTVVRIGESLRDEAELRDKVENWMVRAAEHLVSQYGVEITAIITETIERWDAEEASRRIELHVGRDLQFIRINGTVVGALAGLAIYAVAQLLF